MRSTNMTKIVPPYIQAFTALYLACLMGFNAVVLKNPELGDVDSMTFIVSWVILHATSLTIFFMIRRRAGLDTMMLFIFCFYVVSSSLWSPNFVNRLPYSIMLAGNAIFAYACMKIYGIEDFLEILRKVIVAMIFLGLLMYVVGYQNVYYIDTHERSNVLGLPPMRGFFSHKIMAAMFACIALSLTYYRKKSLEKKISIAAIILFIALTGSATGLMILFLMIAILGIVNLSARYKLSPSVFVGAIVIFALLSLTLFYFFGQDVLYALGRDPTLTGRTVLWRWGVDAYLQRPFFGWGLLGYFQSPNAASVLHSVRGFENYEAPHFHDSFIQTAGDFGIFGLIFLVYNLGMVLLRGYSKMLETNKPIYYSLVVSVLLCVCAAVVMHMFYTYNRMETFYILTLFFWAIGSRESAGRRSSATPRP